MGCAIRQQVGDCIMPRRGVFCRILKGGVVKPGDSFRSGQVLLILEAMKMENEIMAPCDGKVVSVSVQSGTSVNSGDVLIAYV